MLSLLGRKSKTNYLVLVIDQLACFFVLLKGYSLSLSSPSAVFVAVVTVKGELLLSSVILLFRKDKLQL